MSATLREVLNEARRKPQHPQTVRPGWPPFAVWQRNQRTRRAVRGLLRHMVDQRTILLPPTRGLAMFELAQIGTYGRTNGCSETQGARSPAYYWHYALPVMQRPRIVDPGCGS